MKTEYFILGLIIVVLAIVQAVGYVAKYAPLENYQTISINGHKVYLDVVYKPAEREIGLSGRESIADNCGMLFVFRNPGIYGFWMKNMKFPIDIIWLEEGKVVDIAENMPPPKTPEEAPATHTPTVDSDRVLELKAGQARRFDLEVGSSISDLP